MKLLSALLLIPSLMLAQSPGARMGGVNIFTSSNDFSTATLTAPFRIGSADPGTCDNTKREWFYNTTSGLLKKCDSLNTWTSYQSGGDVSSNTSSSTTGQLAIFANTGGKLIGVSTLTGVLKAASGVAAVVTGTASDCVKVDGSSGACGSGGGASAFSALTDCQVTRTSTTVLTITACKIRVGNTVTDLTGTATVTITANSGTALINADLSVTPARIVVHKGGSITASCSGMSCVSDTLTTSGYREIPLATATATSGTWDVSGVTEARAAHQRDLVSGGPGISEATSGTGMVLSADFAIVTRYDLATVTFSGTPTATVVAAKQAFKITLTGNMTSLTMASPITGGEVRWVICQDATGGRTWAWPATYLGADSVGTTASKCTVQTFLYDGTNYLADGPAKTNI